MQVITCIFLCGVHCEDGNKDVKEFCMKVHLFSAASSTGCANYVLNHLAKESESVSSRLTIHYERLLC